MDCRRHAELRDDAGFVDERARADVELHDARAADALRQILVGRPDDHATHPLVPRRNRRRCRQGVVGLELHHRPDDDAERRERLFEQRELRQQIRLDAFARLVAAPEIVAEGLDHVVGRDTDVRGSVLDESQHGSASTPLTAATSWPLMRRAPTAGRSSGGTARTCRRSGGLPKVSVRFSGWSAFCDTCPIPLERVRSSSPPFCQWRRSSRSPDSDNWRRGGERHPRRHLLDRRQCAAARGRTRRRGRHQPGR